MASPYSKPKLAREQTPGEQLSKTAKHDTIAGQQCGYIPMLDGRAGQFCAWSQMRTYPNALERDIAPKVDFGPIGDPLRREHAIKFEARDKFDDMKMFSPPSGIRLEDRNKIPWWGIDTLVN